MRQLYALGSNGNGQLGLGTTDDERNGPVRVPLEQAPDLVDVAAGGNHTLLLTASGRVFATGLNSQGQCSVTGATHVVGFQDTGMPTQAAAIAAGWTFSLALDRTGCIWTCGLLEHAHAGPAYETWTCLHRRAALPQFVSIAASLHHWLAVTRDGDVWGCGAARKGQLGAEQRGHGVVREPVEIMRNVGRDCVVRCMPDTSVVATRSSILLLGGRFEPLPAAATRERVDVQVNWKTLHILRDDGQVESYGRNTFAQHAPPHLPPVARLSAGSEHCLAVLRDARAVAWGWNEHGNCGVSSDTAFNVLPLPAGRVVVVHAGYGTSFFVVQVDGPADACACCP